MADYFIRLENIPASKSQPVEVLVDGKSIYKDSKDGDVNVTLEGHLPNRQAYLPAAPFEVTLDIPIYGCHQKKSIDLNDGKYIAFIASPKGLEILQEKKPPAVKPATHKVGYSGLGKGL
eukprot:TRINITY_DN8406_c0_g1_i1.p1 TRINITY_DN8406_c0_g1~~TRINITY_DN8406_c0_g1_i1.p1  ORF type:complete len:119 (-),score=21.34 TRINITY_DN8406_c0_g1_i1:8-364(-)